MREVRLNQTVNVQAGNRLKRLHRAELGHDYVFLERDDGVELVKCHISQTKFNLPHCFFRNLRNRSSKTWAKKCKLSAWIDTTRGMWKKPCGLIWVKQPFMKFFIFIVKSTKFKNPSDIYFSDLNPHFMQEKKSDLSETRHRLPNCPHSHSVKSSSSQ